VVFKVQKTHNRKFKQQWLGPYQIQYCLPNNTFLLIAINKFDPHPILVNANKFKPYQFSEVSQGQESGVQRGGGGNPNE
jgi:hypothetical protein